MSAMSELDAICKEAVEWRRAIHRNPETGFEELATSDFVTEQLQSFGIEVHRGLGGTGLHNPSYDFNDQALPFGVRYWIKLAEQRLAQSP
jgi:metal-dependent amidase/aminoacylase/carboxypeptidase family protein